MYRKRKSPMATLLKVTQLFLMREMFLKYNAKLEALFYDFHDQFGSKTSQRLLALLFETFLRVLFATLSWVLTRHIFNSLTQGIFNASRKARSFVFSEKATLLRNVV